MKYFVQIQQEFVKHASNWDDLSLKEQNAYLRKHPKSKRRLTAKPDDKQIEDLRKSVKKLDQNLQKNYHTLELKNISDELSKTFEVDEDFENDSFNVTNKKGFSVYFTKTPEQKEFVANVQGYSSDIPLGEVGNDYKELKEIVDGINTSWMKENDPKGDQW